jgi:5-methylcytosine-specific restriction protein A
MTMDPRRPGCGRTDAGLSPPALFPEMVHERCHAVTPPGGQRRGRLRGMEAIILAWTTAGPQWSGSYASDIATVRRTGLVRREWVVPDDPAVVPGIDVWLLVVDGGAAMRGVIGHGTIIGTSGIMSGDTTGNTSAGGEGTLRLDIDVDVLLDHGDQLPLSQVESILPGVLQQRADTIPLDGPSAAAMRTLWAGTIGPDRGSREPTAGSLPQRMTTRISANRFERDPDLRRIALAHRGSLCQACDVDLEQVYGDAAHGLMEVHHITPFEHLTADYQPDPLVDLIPLCPTCHLVAHSRWPEPYGVQELRSMIREGGFLRGRIMTDEQLAAEAAAARLLDGG